MCLCWVEVCEEYVLVGWRYVRSMSCLGWVEVCEECVLVGWRYVRSVSWLGGEM